MAHGTRARLHPGTSCVQIADVRAQRRTVDPLVRSRFATMEIQDVKIQLSKMRCNINAKTCLMNAIVVPIFGGQRVVLCQRQDFATQKHES